MLVGREREVDAVAGLLGHGSSVALVGEAGIGKTAVLEAVAGSWSGPVATGGGLSTLQWVDYAALARALGGGPAQGDSAAIARRLRSRLGDRGLLVLDDLQWADGGTLDVVDRLAPAQPMLVAVRTAALATDEVLARLRHLGFREQVLLPLSDEDATTLVRSIRPDLGATALARLVRRCGGSPLLLSQLAGAGEGAESLRISLASRLRDLPAAAVDVFGLLAVLAHPVPPLEEESGALAALEAAGLVARRGETVEVAHAVLGELVLGRLPARDRQRLHRLAAERATTPGEVARHLEAAGDRAAALEVALEAAETAATAVDRAAQLVLAARCADGPDADDLRLCAAAAAILALHHDDADAVLAAVRTDDPVTRARTGVLRSRTAWFRGDDAAFRTAIDDAVAAGALAGGAPHAEALVERSRVAIFLEPDAEPGPVTLAREGLAAACRAGIPTARAEMLLGLAQYMTDDATWRTTLDGALRRARAEGDVDTELTAANNLVTAHESSGDPAAGRAIGAALVERAGQLGLTGWQLQFRALLVNLDLHAGAYAPAVEAAIELLDEPLDRRARAQVEASLAICLIDLGRDTLALDRLAELEQDPSALVAPDVLAWLRAEAAFHGGRDDDALMHAHRALELGFVDPFAALVDRWAALELGRDPGEPLPDQPTPLLRGAAPESSGIRALHRGAAAEAADCFRAAAELWRPYHRRGEVRARWGAAEALRRAGRASDARSQLLCLEAELEEAGMAPMLARVRRSLRQLGVRRAAARSRRDPQSLTAREHEVMGLVASGHTNREIARRLGLSHATATDLVQAAMSALGASTRGQAAARWRG